MLGGAQGAMGRGACCEVGSCGMSAQGDQSRRGPSSQGAGCREQSLESELMPWRETWMGVQRVPPPQGAPSSLPGKCGKSGFFSI